MKLPFLGQQVSVQYLDSSLTPVTFAGWCVDLCTKSFTLTDGYSIRKFFFKSPLLLDTSLFSFFGDNDYFNNVIPSSYDEYKAHINALALQKLISSKD